MAEPIDLDHLEELAQKATPGPWYIDSHGHCMVARDGAETVFATDPKMGEARRHPETGNLSRWPNDWDASFIAATGPDVVLELIARLRHAVEAADAARSALNVQEGLLAEARADDRQAMSYLEQVRTVLGHNGDFPSMIDRVRDLVREASDPQMDALMALLAEARPHVVGSPDSVRGGLIEEIDAALAKRAEESQ